MSQRPPSRAGRPVRALTTPGVGEMSPRAMGALLDIQAARDPDRPALTFDGRTLTRRELASAANRRARALARAGVKAGDFVAVALPNGPALLEIVFGVWALGATPAPLSHRLPPAELAAILDLLSPALVVTEIVGVGGDRPGATPAELDDPTLDDSPLPEQPARHLKAIASGGSTGRPKVIVDAAPGLADPDRPLLCMRADDVLLNPGPLYHAAPFGMTCFALGWGLHVVIMPRFDAEETLRLIDRHRVRWLFQVPTMMHRIWSLPEETRARYDVSSLDIVMHIAAPCPPWLKKAWIDWVGAEVVWELYTGTEALGGTGVNGAEWLEKPGTVGRVLPGYEMRVLDAQGRACATDEVGEVFFRPLRGRGSTYRYLGAEPRAVGEFETLGDMGRVDADGYLFLTDRRTDLILSGGANVYPAEVEAALESAPGVLGGVVIGLPDQDLGQTVHAIIEIAPGAEIDEAVLRRHLEARLVPYKRPRSFEFTTQRLRDDAGKVRRGALRDARLTPPAG